MNKPLNLNTMKKFISIYFIAIMTILCAGCGSEDEVPPRMDPIDNDYQLPLPTTLTAEDREAIRQLQLEYEEATADAASEEAPSTENDV